jgi:hypothetical protein
VCMARNNPPARGALPSCIAPTEDAAKRPRGSLESVGISVGGHLTPPQAGAHDREQYGVFGSRVLEVVWQVGVEGHAIAGEQLETAPVAGQHHLTRLDQRRLAASGLMEGWVAAPAGRGTGRQRVGRQLGALPG